ncbi:hypothetical protein F5148DRAFT_823184 [Russula earlei]|uniref:Uncharacterized protein n=1 Tax=Russula earlei TaxID=71964 RepID=A0ACC0UBA7_9AGAM|nr:hypothetical protein F5148DRAFT_823184 [Russula earlei]
MSPSRPTTLNAPHPEYLDTPLEPQPPENTSDRVCGFFRAAWGVVFKEGEKYDKTLVESWKGDMDGILFFTGLFSATVAAFLIDGYKYLSRNSNDTTNQLLTQISQQLSASATGSEPPPPFSLPPFAVPAAMLQVNILWFLSLSLSLACALSATLVQQWARKYLLTTQLPSSPQRRARVRTYLFQGVLSFKLDTVANTVPVLLHASLFLFFTGLVQFLFQINDALAHFLLACVVVCAIVYLALTLIPLFYRDCPYLTPMSGPLWRFLQFSQFVSFAFCRHMYKTFAPNWTPRLMSLTESVGKCKERFWGGLQYGLERRALDASHELDTSALRWTLKSLREPSELESFIAGIPGFLGSEAITSETPQLTPSSITLYNLLHVTDVHLGLRIGHLLKTQLHTPIACVDALWHITRWYDVVSVRQWDRAFGEATIDSLRALKGSRDVSIALVARCVAALGVRVGLKDLRRILDQAPGRKLRIVELRKMLHGLMDTERPDVESFTNEELIRDGHLLNMADVLTGVVPLLPGVDETRAHFLWDTLDTLRVDLEPQRASLLAQTAIVDTWRAYEVEFRIWESGPAVFPRPSPGSIDRYRSRMQKLVRPIVEVVQHTASG